MTNEVPKTTLSSAWLVNLALLMAGCLLAVIAGEVLLRVTGLGSPTPLIPYERLPFKRRPSHEFLNRREVVRWVELNSWGFHDRERDATSSSYRFLALGDSFVEGLQVAVEDLFTTRIQTRLREHGLDVEVLNAGVGGVGTAYEYLLYEDFFQGRIEVDHVLLFVFNGNDLGNNHPLLEAEAHGNDPDGKVYVDGNGQVFVRPYERNLRQRLMAFADRHSALAYTLHASGYQIKRIIKEWSRNPGAGRPALSPKRAREESVLLEEAWRTSIRGTVMLVDQWQRKLESRGVELSIVILPDTEHWVNPPYGHPFKARFATELESLSQRSEIPLLALHFEGREPGDIFTYDGERYGHFTPTGHRIAGDVVAEWLLD